MVLVEQLPGRDLIILFLKNLRRFTLKNLRKWSYGCRILGIPIKRISVAETNQYFEKYGNLQIYFKTFPSQIVNLKSPQYINKSYSEISGVYTGKSFIMNLVNATYYHHHPSVVTPEGFQLAIVSNHPEVNQEQHVLFENFFLPRQRMIKGISLLLSTANDNNYYHCLFQIAPKVWQVQKNGYTLEQIDHFLLEKSTFDFQKEILDKLGIDENKIIGLKSNRGIKAEQMLLTPSFWKPEPWFCHKIKSLFLENSMQLKGPKRIYISRRKAKFRKLINEEKFLEALAQFNFQLIFTEGLTIKEQARIFNEAEIIISPHGAAFSNIVFCEEDTKILELRALSHSGDLGLVFEQLSSICKLQHYTYYCEEIENDFGRRPKFKDLKVDIQEITNFLYQIGIKK